MLKNWNDWNFWLSAITSLTAITALFQTQLQIRLNNKQHLFDKRLENYLIAMGLLQLYEKNYYLLEKEERDSLFLTTDFMFSLLTNNSYLENITHVIHTPLEEPFHKDFLIKIENIKDVATKIKLLFAGTVSNSLGDFVLHYQELLFTMYQYQIIFIKMQQTSENYKLSLEQTKNLIDENSHKEKVLIALDNLKKSYDILKKNNVEKKIKKQIKL